MSDKTYCLSEQCPAVKEESAFTPGPGAFGSAWTVPDPKVKKNCLARELEIEYMRDEQKWEIIQELYPGWKAHIDRHDAPDAQGARRIIRLPDSPRPTPYGNDYWGKTFSSICGYTGEAGPSTSRP